MKNIFLLLIFILGFQFLKSQNRQYEILNSLINKISNSALPYKYVDKKYGKVTDLENGRYTLNKLKYPNYGIEFMQPIIGQYNILIVDVSKFENYKNKLVNFDKHDNIKSFIEKNSLPLKYELIKKAGRNQILLKYHNYEVQSKELSDQVIEQIDVNNIDLSKLKNIKISSIWFIYNAVTPPSIIKKLGPVSVL